MEISYLSKFTRIIVLALFVYSNSLLFGFETKRFDSPPPSRPKYLTSIQPPTLTYSMPVYKVDRRKLILPPTMAKPTTAIVDNSVENNASEFVEPDFPLISLDQNSSPFPSAPIVQNVLPIQAPVQSLPLSDPFDEVTSKQINSTDELLQIFEQVSNSNQVRTAQPLPFIPPYSVAPDSMRVSAKATYRRVRR